MEKSLKEVLKEGGEYEIVGLLVGRFGVAQIMRAISPEGKVYYYYALTGSDDDEEECFVEVLDKTKKGEEGYPTPSLIEEMILGMVAEGFLFYLSLLEKYRSDEKVGGKTLKDWYEGFLNLFETVQGRPIAWHTYAELYQALFFIEIPKDEWPEYWTLTIWEREELMRRFELFVSEIWEMLWNLIGKVALKLEKQQGKTRFTLQDIVEFLERRKPTKTIQAIYNMLGFEKSRMDKEQKEWVLSIIWQKLLEAAKEDRELTFYDINAYLGYEDEEEE